jgi:hypothetical protein
MEGRADGSRICLFFLSLLGEPRCLKTVRRIRHDTLVARKQA